MPATSDDEDRQLMLHLAKGQDSALTALMNRWQDRLIGFIIRMGTSHTTACDLAQETFVRLYRHRSTYNPRQSFSTWIFTIAANLVRNYHRWTTRHPETITDPSLLAQDPSPHLSPDPSESLAAKEKLAAVQAAIAQLPADQRETLILATYEHLSHDQIAAITHTTPKAVELRLYRARQSLRETLTSLL